MRGSRAIACLRLPEHELEGLLSRPGAVEAGAVRELRHVVNPAVQPMFVPNPMVRTQHKKFLARFQKDSAINLAIGELSPNGVNLPHESGGETAMSLWFVAATVHPPGGAGIFGSGLELLNSWNPRKLNQKP